MTWIFHDKPPTTAAEVMARALQLAAFGGSAAQALEASVGEMAPARLKRDGKK